MPEKNGHGLEDTLQWFPQRVYHNPVWASSKKALLLNCSGNILS